MTTLTVFDGADSIGGNKIHLESGGRGLFLDFGTNYKRMGQFYEEYLKPRSVRGIHDYLAMGLVPPVDIYRRDLVPSDFSAKLQPLRLDAVFLSHAHMDHAGCIGLLDPKIPIYASPMTATILKAHQDSGKTDLPHEVAYFTTRAASGEPRVLDAQKSIPHRSRKFFCVPAPGEKLREFWRYSTAAKGLEPEELEEAKAGPIPFNAFEVDHSIYGATAYAFETDAGWVVYTGDLRMHGTLASKTREFVHEASKLNPRVLITEGTRVGREKEAGESEEDVHENCLAAVRAERGLVVADFSPRNFERLETFSKVAGDVGRRLVVTTRDAYMLRATECVDGVNRMKDFAVYWGLKGKVDRWERGIQEDFRDRILDPEDVAKDPGAYILCFSFWDVKNLLDIGARGGTYIYSSSEAFSEEAEFDFCRLWEWLRFFGLRVVGFRVEGGRPEFEPGYHASGHASPGELLEMVEEIGPKIVVPVHTENPEFFKKNVKGRDVRLVKNGSRIEIS